MHHILIIRKLPVLLFTFFLVVVSCREEPTDKNAGNNIMVDSVDPVLEDYEVPERKMGYVDENGEIVIDAKFDEVRNFSESMAAVNQNGLWGYIDTGGQWAIPNQYLGAWTFQHGRGRVQSAQNRLFGYLSATGDTLVDLMYDEARNYSGKLAAVREGSFWGVIDLQGAEVVPPQFDNVKILGAEYIAVSDKDIWGVFHVEEGLIIPHKYQDIYSLRGNILRVKNATGHHVFIDLNGKPIFDEMFFKAGDPQEGVFAVCDSIDYCYLLGREGNRISEIYQNLHPGNEGLFIGKSNGKWGVIRADGSPLIPFRYDLIYNFEEGFAPYLINNLWGYLSADGNVMTSPQFGLAWPFENNKARVLTRSGTAFINSDFEIVVQSQLGEIRDFHEGLAAFKAY